MKKTALIFSFLCFFSVLSQEKTPFVKGKVNISVKEGTFECDLTLSDIPNLKNYFIRLNSGMNLLHIKSKKPKEFVIGYAKSRKDTTSTGESLAYFFPDSSGKGKFLPQELQFKYVGKFPVATDTIQNYSRKDWKGNIAFNGYSLRADGFQSAWYPILYDIETDKLYDKVKYDIELTCKDCNTLYINGNLPVKGNSAHFKSENLQEMSLFCGDYKISNLGKTYLLNADFDQKQLSEFDNLIQNYKDFYQTKLKIPFDQATVFVQTTPTSKNDGWLFVSYPTIYNIGWGTGLKSLLNPETKDWFRPFIAHELGHFYFGTYKVFNSLWGDMMSEGFAEYLSLQVTKNIIGKEVHQQKINKFISDIEKHKLKFTSFSKLKSREDYGDRNAYVYYYAPLIFSAIEKEIGEEKMWKWLQNILKSPANFTDYDFLCQSLKSTLNNEKLYQKVKENYFESDEALSNAIKKLK